MKKIDLQNEAGKALTVQVPTHWGEVTLRTFMGLQKKTQPEQFALLCGITLEQYLSLSSNAVEAIAAVLGFVAEEPLEDESLDYPKNLGAESIGQMELAKKAIQGTVEAGEFAAIPYLYAIYLRPGKIDFLSAFVHGFPEVVAEEVRELPVTEVLGPAVYFLGQVLEITARYSQQINREPDPDHLAAGFDRLTKFGFFGQLISRAKDWDERARLMKVPADFHYMELVYDAIANDCLKDLQEIQKNKASS